MRTLLQLRQTLASIVKVTFKLALVLCVVFSYGGGSALLQGVAWLTMVPKEIIATGSLQQGVKNTFDGEHPCPLCKAAEELRSSDVQSPVDKPFPEKDTKPSPKLEKMAGILFPRYCFGGTVQRLQREDTSVPWLSSVSLHVDTPPPQLG